MLALHSLAHVLVDEMSLTSGYPAASLRERVYDDEGQSGILVYTATADSAGSLGGLAALSDKDRFAQTLANGIRRARWCTADPVCIESTGSGVNGMNLAACHACLLLPETSCERFNLTLDRATPRRVCPTRPQAGFSAVSINSRQRAAPSRRAACSQDGKEKFLGQAMHEAGYGDASGKDLADDGWRVVEPDVGAVVDALSAREGAR